MTIRFDQEATLGTASTKPSRIDISVSRGVFETLCRAAELKGKTVGQFVVQSALKDARTVVERDRTIRVSGRDWNWLLNLLENPPEPNPRLRATVKRHLQAERDVAGVCRE